MIDAEPPGRSVSEDHEPFTYRAPDGAGRPLCEFVGGPLDGRHLELPLRGDGRPPATWIVPSAPPERYESRTEVYQVAPVTYSRQVGCGDAFQWCYQLSG